MAKITVPSGLIAIVCDISTISKSFLFLRTHYGFAFVRPTAHLTKPRHKSSAAALGRTSYRMGLNTEAATPGEGSRTGNAASRQFGRISLERYYFAHVSAEDDRETVDAALAASEVGLSVKHAAFAEKIDRAGHPAEFHAAVDRR